MAEPIVVENGLAICYGAIENVMAANSESQVQFTKAGAAFAENTIKYQDFYFKDKNDDNWSGWDLEGTMTPQEWDTFFRNFKNLEGIKKELLSIGNDGQNNTNRINKLQAELNIMNTQVSNKTTQAQKDYSNNAEQGSTLASNGAALVNLAEHLKGILSTLSSLVSRR